MTREAGPQRLFSALRDEGLPEIPTEFSVAFVHQEIPGAVMEEIDAFIRTFERVTTRTAWREAAAASAPAIARREGREVCFFSAWDFHLPPGRPEAWQLIEFNDNGSGFLFAAAINRLFWEWRKLDRRDDLVSPPLPAAFRDRLIEVVAHEAREFFGAHPEGLFLVLDDRDSLAAGRFRRELLGLRDLFREHGWPSELAAPDELRWEGQRLRLGAREVSFVVNRSTDFLWEDGVFAPLRAAWTDGVVYAAPNPSTYATRSDKGLLELLSSPDRDAELGIEPAERELLTAHVPKTRRLREENLEELAREKHELVFKPDHGFAGRGLLPSAAVGRTRLRRLLRRGEGYVAQARVPRSRLGLGEDGSGALWADLRVWAWRGQRLLLSGRGSRSPDRLDLTPPGGWLATYEGCARDGAARAGPPRFTRASRAPRG
ncbi:MAG: hypothetical protein QNK04_34215 [Myxococcota bacterium]|nr:hypothetical protein [Myxococcota bacterium]